MARLAFFMLAATFCVAACLPLKSNSSESWADVTFAIGCEDYGTGMFYDRQLDFPTGGFFIDVPPWAIDAGLFSAASLAFGFYAKRKVQEQKV